jgi:hypothetical protein
MPTGNKGEPVKKLLGLLSAALLACACVAPPKENEHLRPARRSEVITLPDRISRVTQGNWRGQQFEHGIFPGRYVSVKENAHGTFFLGPGRPLYERPLPDGRYILRKGGIWVPKGGDGKPRLFIAFEPETVTADAGALTAISTSSGNAARVSGSTIVSQTVGGPIGGAITDAFAERDRGKFMVLVPDGDPEFDGKLLVHIARKSVTE